jgi:NADPH:quinone reductase-like Zn-dependent oxidoreductase
MMGYKTPNIDRIAEEGMTFTDYYGEQSCTAGRSAFIMGQSVFRTGLSKVGLPGAKEGMQEILKGVEKGWVRPHVDRTFLFEQVGEAHAYIEARKNIGKIVLVTGG